MRSSATGSPGVKDTETTGVNATAMEVERGRGRGLEQTS
jgi:hypothetical protein